MTSVRATRMERGDPARSRYVYVMLPALLLACAHRPIDVSVVAATIGPSAADLSPWDGFGKVPAGVRDAAIAAASGIDPSAGAATATFVAVLDGVAPPDARGELWIANGDPNARVVLPEQADTFVPRWAGATLRDVLLAPDQRLVLRLVDADLDDPDLIGTVELSSADLRAALGKRDGVTVVTAERTQGQLLSVTIKVASSAKK